MKPLIRRTQTDPKVFQSKFTNNFPVTDYYVQKADCGGLVVSRRLANGYMDVRICYEREFLYYCAKSPYAILPPSNIRNMVLEIGEIISKFPHRFSKKDINE